MNWAIIAFKGYFLIVSADYHTANGKYKNHSVNSALYIVDEYVDGNLPNPEIVDAIQAQATCKVRTPARNPADRKSMARQANKAAAEVAKCKDRTLVSGHYKDVVIARNGEVGIYGWYSGPGGRRIQPFYAGHSVDYVDYSQALRIVLDKKYLERSDAEHQINRMNK